MKIWINRTSLEEKIYDLSSRDKSRLSASSITTGERFHIPSTGAPDADGFRWTRMDGVCSEPNDRRSMPVDMRWLQRSGLKLHGYLLPFTERRNFRRPFSIRIRPWMGSTPPTVEVLRIPAFVIGASVISVCRKRSRADFTTAHGRSLSGICVKKIADDTGRGI